MQHITVFPQIFFWFNPFSFKKEKEKGLVGHPQVTHGTTRLSKINVS
jgi:hypothetical protein